MADRVYRYRVVAPSAPRIAPLIDFPLDGDGHWIGTLIVGPPSTDVFVDVVIDEMYKAQLDYAMTLYDYEFYAEAPAAIAALPASYEPLVEVQAAPVGGRVQQVDWYQTYPNGGAPAGHARRRVDTWQGQKLIQTAITDYWNDGTPIVTRTYTYETTAAGARISREA